MRSIQTLRWASSGAVVLMTMAGCHHDRPERVYVEPQPEYVEVAQAPPTVIVEPRPYAPGPGYMWIDGYWGWGGDRYVWERGHWAAPPRGYSVWVGPRYDRYGRGYRYAPGHWSRERGRYEHERDRERR